MGKDPWIPSLHAWDERIGPDASLTHVGGGKKQFPGCSQRMVSNIPIPLRDNQPFLVPMPAAGELTSQGPVVVSTDVHMWRSYRSMMSSDSGLFPEGKKMNAKPVSNSEVQAHMRKCLRAKVRSQEAIELAALAQSQRQREELLKRHAQLAEAEEKFLRKRAASIGFEGLRKPVSRPAPSLPPISPDLVEQVLHSSTPHPTHMEGYSGGKRIFRDHPSIKSHGAPFGSSMTSAALIAAGLAPEPSILRWDNKSLI